MAGKGKKRASKVPKKKVEFAYKGYSLDEFQKIELGELAKVLPSRQRRKIKRGFNSEQKRFLQRIQTKDEVRTHLRDMIILPNMVGKKIAIHDGKQFNSVEIQPEMIGHYLGEFALTRKRITHGSAGIGATKSSKFVPLK